MLVYFFIRHRAMGHYGAYCDRPGHLMSTDRVALRVTRTQP
jgi:hypothetical protein